MTRALYLCLHTHWDREWYWSFGAFRTQLVTVIKNIVHLLETGALDKFMLDGQTSLIEDVLEVSPALGPRIRDLVKGGKLSIGPWYVLADQMLVGGESLVRNLHYGLALSETFGGATRVGYCPDTFGHTADLPRILRGFGIDCAVVWRGVPQLVQSPLFSWKSPDGSEVLALDLTRGYYQSVFGEGLRAEALAAHLLGFLELETDSGGHLTKKNNAVLTMVPQLHGALLPVGADHVGPQWDFNEQLKAALAVINGGKYSTEKTASAGDDGHAAVSAETVSLTQFFAKVRAAGAADQSMRVIEGELRDNSSAFEYSRAYMLDGVLSTRLYLKRANRLSEHKILRQVEPFRALLAVHKILPYGREELDFSWKLLLKNQPHDSICGCSIDAVHSEMQTRTASLNDGLDILITQGKEALLRSTGSDAAVRFGAGHLDVIDPDLKLEQLVVFNPSTSPYVGPVRVRLARIDGDETELPIGFQQVGAHLATETFLGLSRVPIFKDVIVVDGYLDAGIVPGATLQAVSIASPSAPLASASAAGIGEDSRAFASLKLSNQFFTIKFDQEGGLTAHVKVNGQTGRSRSTDDTSSTGGIGSTGRTGSGADIKLGHRLVDLGDAGDSYNFDPIAGDKPILAKLVAVLPGRRGPLVASLIARYEINLPDGIMGKGEFCKEGEAAQAPKLTVFERSGTLIRHVIESEIILKRNVPVVFFETTMQNNAGDHRLEVVFDLEKDQEFTFSENHFALIKRYHNKQAQLHTPVAAADIVDLGHEAPLSRYPCQRFFVAGDGTFMNIGLPEYGVGDSAVSITLLRAVSYLSRQRLRTRGGGAGPIIPTPEANCLGLMRATYGWAPTALAAAVAGDNISSEAAPYVLADLFEGEPIAFVSPTGGVADKSLSLFAVDDPDIRVTATYIAADDRLVIRLLNATTQSKSVRLTLPFATQMVSLANFDGSDERRLSSREGGGIGTQAAAGTDFMIEFNPCQLLTVFCRI